MRSGGIGLAMMRVYEGSPRSFCAQRQPGCFYAGEQWAAGSSGRAHTIRLSGESLLPEPHLFLSELKLALNCGGQNTLLPQGDS
jgi:hypothetical protein